MFYIQSGGNPCEYLQVFELPELLISFMERISQHGISQHWIEWIQVLNCESYLIHMVYFNV
jgi:hypothetical protein